MVENKTMAKARKKVDNLTKSLEGYDNTLYKVVKSPVPEKVMRANNKKNKWKSGWNSEYDFVNISKDGTIGEFYLIQGLLIALPSTPKTVHSRSKEKEEQYWDSESSPDERMLMKLKSIKQLSQLHPTKKAEWENFIVQEWERRDDGFWFMNEGKPTYISGSHYFFLRWAKIDVGAPHYREANRIYWYFWEACKVDKRSLGMCYLKNRRSGFSYMAMSETVNLSSKPPFDSQYGMLSKTGADAQSMFTIKCVKIANNLPFFFSPIRSGEAKPKSEIVFAKPSTKITMKTLEDMQFIDESEGNFEGLDNKINWKTTNNNSYDGEKLKLLVHDESGKWTVPNNINNNWSVTKTCLITGSRVIGKCMMGSTSNKLSEGGENFKKLYEGSDLRKTDRSRHGQTSSGLYCLFIPMEWNIEGNIDIYGKPVFITPEIPRLGLDEEFIAEGSINWWEDQVKTKRRDPGAQNEHIRQFPRTENHAFRDEVLGALFNIAKINQQIDHNDSLEIPRKQVSEGVFQWTGGVKDTQVEFVPRKDGKFKISWMPPASMQNKINITDGQKRPGNDGLGAFGCDPYDIDGVNYGFGSNGALHGITSVSLNDNVPSMQFFLEYIARPQTSYIFFEDILMACVFFGMPILVENNKPRLLFHFKNRGYMHYTMLRPDKRPHELKPGDLTTRGIPNSSEDVRQLHAGMIESYVEEYIGEDDDGNMGHMPFNRTMQDWIRFDITKRTDYDASISSGLALMAVRKNLILPKIEVRNRTIPIPMGRYRNDGNHSTLL